MGKIDQAKNKVDPGSGGKGASQDFSSLSQRLPAADVAPAASPAISETITQLKRLRDGLPKNAIRQQGMSQRSQLSTLLANETAWLGGSSLTLEASVTPNPIHSLAKAAQGIASAVNAEPKPEAEKKQK